MSAVQHILSAALQRSHSAGTPLSQVMREDAVIYQKIRPNIKLVRTKETLPTAKFYDALGDASMSLRTGPVAVSQFIGHPMDSGATSAIGFSAVLGCVVGIGRALDGWKQIKGYEKIGDQAGANLARALIVENSSLAGGSAFLTALRVMGAVQEFFKLTNNPLTLSPAMATLQTALSWISAALFSVMFLIFAGRQVFGLVGLSKGNDLREKLLNSKDPIEELRKYIDSKMFKGSDFTGDECREMALQEGAIWLEKLEKEGREVPWEKTEESRRKHALVLFLNDPEFMMSEMGKPAEFDRLTPIKRLVRFGRYIGQKRLSAKITNDLKWQLGSEAMEIFNTEKPDRATFEKALKSAHWSEWGVRWKTVLKIGLAVVCTAALILGTMGTGGLALAIPLLLLGVGGVLWIALFDGASFKSQWESGEISKKDKILVALSTLVSVISLGFLIAGTVLTGGAILYVAGMIFALTWLVINARACYLMADNLERPWIYQKQVTVEAFRKFLETNPSAEVIKKILEKMSKEDQAGIASLIKTGLDFQKAAEAWEKHLADLKEESLDFVLEELLEASRVVQRMTPIAK